MSNYILCFLFLLSVQMSGFEPQTSWFRPSLIKDSICQNFMQLNWTASKKYTRRNPITLKRKKNNFLFSTSRLSNTRLKSIASAIGCNKSTFVLNVHLNSKAKSLFYRQVTINIPSFFVNSLEMWPKRHYKIGNNQKMSEFCAKLLCSWYTVLFSPSSGKVDISKIDNNPRLEAILQLIPRKKYESIVWWTQYESSSGANAAQKIAINQL